ncbi:MAG: type IV secretory system conjugative DNA transfer family protein [Brevundimonas sp.]|uniref:type IV secretory system conjugative DNA transfer family protein n=1 Tax=Brevundimonas sp. TaxID=1871086 RepID=UPI002ABBD332|nr:type IV secretory system conjugative DNA transfer family protein [Brevundimonas sp.]MDZ4113580.1 type IV secretory system conjugative DNA transfer family protein [Brevundimonas sp.]
MTLIPVSNTLTLPGEVDDEGLIVAWSLENVHPRRPIGFSFGKTEEKTDVIHPILMEREGHLMTIAPTGAGKGTGCIVPALLRFEGPVIVIDPKGENALVTVRRRRDMGQAVAVIDPMGVTSLPSDSLNPLDILDPDSPTLVDDAMSIVAALVPSDSGSDTSDGGYWRERGGTFVLGVLLHVLSDLPPSQRHLETVRALVNQAVSELGVYSAVAEQRVPPTELAGTVLAALEASRNAEARNIGRMLRIGAITTLGGILSFSQNLVDVVRSGMIAQSLRSTSFDLTAVQRGDPLSIYLILPPHMLDSHGRLLRLWVHTLLTLISGRIGQPAKSTLFILDEAAQLGAFDDLRRAITLMRGYGLQTWSFWQDPSQLQNLYPRDWQTMVNNCRAVQCFGANTMLAAESMSNLVGFPSPGQLLELEPGEMLLQLSGDAPVIARLPNYREDPVFAGMFDANPLYSQDGPVERPRGVNRLFTRQPVEEAARVEAPSEVLKRLRKSS